MKVGTGTASHYDGGDAICLIEFSNAIDKRGNGFHIPVNDTLHQLIANHKIRRAGIFVDEKQGGVGFQALYYIGGLRSAAAGIFCHESVGIFTIRQVVDKHGDVRLVDAAPIFGTDFHCRMIGDDIFPAISSDMRIDSHLQG